VKKFLEGSENGHIALLLTYYHW